MVDKIQWRFVCLASLVVSNTSCFSPDVDKLTAHTLDDCKVVPFFFGCYKEPALISSSRIFFEECVGSQEQQDCLLERSCEQINTDGFQCGIDGPKTSICNDELNSMTDRCVTECDDGFLLCGSGDQQACESDLEAVVGRCIDALKLCLSAC